METSAWLVIVIPSLAVWFIASVLLSVAGRKKSKSNKHTKDIMNSYAFGEKNVTMIESVHWENGVPRVEQMALDAYLEMLEELK